MASRLHRGVLDTPQLTHCLEGWEVGGEDELGLEAVEEGLEREEFMLEDGEGEASWLYPP